MYEQYEQYGAVVKPARKQSSELCYITGNQFFRLFIAYIMPVLVFLAVLYLRAMEVAYWSGLVSLLACVLIFLLFTWLTFKIEDILKAIVFCCCCCRCNDYAKDLRPKERFRLSGFVFTMCVIAWTIAFFSGTYNFKTNFEPYYDVTSLNKYPHVDPSVYLGQQFMDAGQIEFVAGSHLDLRKSYGFKNGHTYCIAPIVAPKFQGSSKNMDNYDFWAVGLDCCSGHTNDFHCGAYASTKANKGLRLMRDDDRNFYRLAVKEATASFGLTANYPIFMYWMEDPEAEIQAHFDHGMFDFIWSIVIFNIFAFLAVIILPFTTWYWKDQGEPLRDATLSP